jgi:lysozyme
MTSHYLSGIDTSNNNGPIDLHAIQSSGKRFMFIKATEGNYYKDTFFTQYWDRIRQLGMIRGAYHFGKPSLPAVEQADYFHEFVRNSGHFRYGDAAILDLEDMDGTPPEHVIQWTQEFMQRCKQMIAKQVIIYTAPYFWQGILGDPDINSLKQFPLWMADWGPNIPTFKTWPTGPAFWQYDGNGHCPGVAGTCDLDRFMGDWRQLQRIMSPPWAT